MVTGHDEFPDRPRPQATTDELESHGLIEHNCNWVRTLVGCQADLTATDLSGHAGWPLYLVRYVTPLTISAGAIYPQAVSCNYRSFNVRPVDDTGCMCRIDIPRRSPS